jgi:hypothetical protein
MHDREGVRRVMCVCFQAFGEAFLVEPSYAATLLVMNEPEKKRSEPTKLGPHPDDRELFEDNQDVLDVDVEAHLRWLETGEGDPWPASRS